MLINDLKKNPIFRDTIKRLREDRVAEIGGVASGAVPYVISAFAQTVERPLLVITADGNTAENLSAAVKTFGSSKLRILPEYKVIPYALLSPNHYVLGKRIETLLSAYNDDSIVLSVESFMRRLPRRSDIVRNTVELSVGGEIDPEQFASRLFDLGYERVDMVEGPGQFARRGGIVDIFTPAAERPIRIEFFGDEIESLRHFDVFSQRRTDNLKSTRIIPCRELLLDDERFEQGLKQIRKTNSDDIAQKVSDAWEIHRYFEGIENLLPYFISKKYSIIDYFKTPPFIIIVDERRCQDAYKSKIEEATKLAISEKEVLPVSIPDNLFISLEDSISDFRNGDGTLLRIIGTLEDSGTSPELGFQPAQSFSGQLSEFAKYVKKLNKDNVTPIIACERAEQTESFREIMEAKFPDFKAQYTVGWLESGFVSYDLGHAVFPAHSILSRSPRKKPSRSSVPSVHREDTIKIGSIFDLKPDELVVHLEHGIGRFVGLTSIPVNGRDEEFMELNYAGGARLYVPVYNLRLVQKYVGGSDKARLDKLGGITWKKSRNKASKAAEDMAKELLVLYAQRQARPGHAFGIMPKWQEELEATFPYTETDDQLDAITDVNTDMSSTRPMDRLICADVGFGKTEVAVRAALRCAVDGKQTAILVPTTILAQQHYATFSERLAPFPVKVEVISRFKSRKEQTEIIEKLATGKIDVIIGTHRLISKDMKFRNLGLLVIDEEQRFGVRHKERIKELKRSVDVLTLTATPIPRTLYMALSGIRDISTINTPPINRLPIMTYITPFDEEIITRAIYRELDRGGQVFFVHNRVQSIDAMADFLQQQMPEVRFGVAHGQMDEKNLERVMLTFLAKNYDVLITTSIIESGLDIPNVNTIIIDRADNFGLSQLHQLRGRVGRSYEQAFSYLLTPSTKAITDTARQRLLAVKESSELGSGYRLAMRDLEIRGAGNLLGSAQSGHVSAVGLDMYMKLLSIAVAKLKGKKPPATASDVIITVSFEASLPRSYVADERQRLSMYRRMGEVTDRARLSDIEEELRDRFGPITEPVRGLLNVQQIRIAAQGAPVRSITIKRNQLNVELKKNANFSPATFPSLNFIDDVKLGTSGDGSAIRLRLTINKKRKNVVKAVIYILDLLKGERKNNEPTKTV